MSGTTPPEPDGDSGDDPPDVGESGAAGREAVPEPPEAESQEGASEVQRPREVPIYGKVKILYSREDGSQPDLAIRLAHGAIKPSSISVGLAAALLGHFHTLVDSTANALRGQAVQRMGRLARSDDQVSFDLSGLVGGHSVTFAFDVVGNEASQFVDNGEVIFPLTDAIERLTLLISTASEADERMLPSVAEMTQDLPPRAVSRFRDLTKILGKNQIDSQWQRAGGDIVLLPSETATTVALALESRPVARTHDEHVRTGWLYEANQKERTFTLEPTEGDATTIVGSYAEELSEIVRPVFDQIVTVRLRSTSTLYQFGAKERVTEWELLSVEASEKR